MIWFLVVFVAMGFGILNTTLMAVSERMREFGLLKALGMRPIRIVKGILTEALIILLVGLFIGNALGLASAWPLSFHGIDLSALAQGVEYAGMSRVIFPLVLPKDVLGANLVVLLLGLLVCHLSGDKGRTFHARRSHDSPLTHQRGSTMTAIVTCKADIQKLPAGQGDCRCASGCRSDRRRPAGFSPWPAHRGRARPPCST
jgi:hypothetical protein